MGLTAGFFEACRLVTGSVAVAIDFFLSRSDFKRARKSGRGRLVNSAAMRARGARRASAGSGASGRDNIPVTAWSSSSNRLRLAISATRLLSFSLRGYGPVRLADFHCIETLAQILQTAELELLDGALAASQMLRNFADAFLLGKAHDNDVALVCGQSVHQPEEARTIFHLPEARLGAEFRRIVNGYFAAMPFRAIDDRVDRDPQKPCSEGNASPLETLQVGQRLMKHVGGEVFGGIAVANPPRDEGINPLKMNFVEIGKASRVLLGSFHQQTLVRLLREPLRRRCSRHHRFLNSLLLYKLLRREKVTERCVWVSPLAGCKSLGPFKLARGGGLNERPHLGEHPFTMIGAGVRRGAGFVTKSEQASSRT